MPVLKQLTYEGHKAFRFYCPGCKCTHMIPVEGPKAWEFDGNMDKPTFKPSILTWGDGWRCHSFIRNGQWQFLGDCTHELAGKTVDMVDGDSVGWPLWRKEE